MSSKIHIRELKLENFKNYSSEKFEFINGFNLISGKNGMGKTNVLDAIYFQSILKSKFAINEQDLILKGASYMRMEGLWHIRGEDSMFALGLERKRKKLSFKGEEILKRSEWIGQIPVFLLSPEDQSLVSEGSKVRRGMIDHLLSVLDSEYLHELLNYNRLLKQRNQYLKSDPYQTKDPVFLRTYSQQMHVFAQKIFHRRKMLTEELSAVFQENYKLISNSAEECSFSYKSELLEEDFLHLHESNLQKDILLKRTTSGIHRDDWIFMIDGNRLKYFGSQGQQKSFILSIKLAISNIYINKTDRIPVLLLDDLFDKLDKYRVKSLFKLLKESKYSQIIITDTGTKSSIDYFEQNKVPYKIFKIENGKITDEKKG